MKTGIYLIILWISLVNVFSQDIELYGGIGTNNAAPPDLLKRQKIAPEYLLLPAEINESFPNRMQFHGGLNFRFGNSSVGLGYSYYSTGSRLSYGDYSGDYTSDIISNWIKISPYYVVSFFNREHFKANVYISLPFNRSIITFEEEIYVHDFESKSDTTYYALSMGISPGLEASFHYSIFHLTLRGLYLYDFQDYLHEKGDGRNYVNNYNRQRIEISWSSFGIELLLGIRIFNFKEEQKDTKTSTITND